MKLAVTYPDAERVVRDLLADLMDGEDVTVGVGVPTDWTPQSGDHLQVVTDGTPDLDYPILAKPTVRITAWSKSTSRAKQLVMVAQGRLAAHLGSDVVSVSPLTGPLPARDPQNRGELASITVRVTVRSTPL